MRNGQTETNGDGDKEPRRRGKAKLTCRQQIKKSMEVRRSSRFQPKDCIEGVQVVGLEHGNLGIKMDIEASDGSKK